MREEDEAMHTTGVFTVTDPWPVTIDLPALTARRAAIRERAGEPEEPAGTP